MEREGRLLRALMEYGASDYYPFHMPGHKRNEKRLDFPNPFSVDITEIDGFDNLHHPEGMLKESMERAAKVYGADRTCYLVNGSTCGVLSAICGCVGTGGKLLMSRNCHKSAYHGVFLNHLKTEYIYPQMIPGFGLQGGLLAEDVRKMLITVPDIRAVLVVSPTYDGIVSDIRGISEAAHEYGLPLIVDEAHGAHFAFGRNWPAPALKAGADVVIQSLHKTLPSLTQTALLHWRRGYVDFEAIDKYLHMFQSSSPSYVLMAAMERCIEIMEEDGETVMETFGERLHGLRNRLRGMRQLRLLDRDVAGSAGVWDMDLSKVVVSTRGTELNGVKLGEILRERYHLEMEMCGPDYVTAITTAWDSAEGLDRLGAALLEIDGRLEGEALETGGRLGKEALEADVRLRRRQAAVDSDLTMEYPVIAMGIREASDREQETIRFMESAGRISGEYLYLYPPGIPILAPGEVISEAILDQTAGYRRMGLPVQGLRDESLAWIRVVKKQEITMGKIFYVMGKSASGKDTIYKRLLDEFPRLKTVTLYTTRPIRDGERDGVEYYFADGERLKELRAEGRVIEERTYQTVHGPWSYFTVDDGQFDLEREDYLMIGTLESYGRMQEYFGRDRMMPIYVYVEDGVRLERALQREKLQKEPRYQELCRRFLADDEDFKKENRVKLGITAGYENRDLELCLEQIGSMIKKNL